MKKLGILENQVNYAYLAIGSNLGKKIYNLEFVKYKLFINNVYIVKSSNFYQTKSWPNSKFPDYINAVLFVRTNLSLHELFKKIKIIEKSIGRVKSPKNYPRICDIDIIDFNSISSKSYYLDQEINIPHREMHQRNFVLIPFYEINKIWIHPKFKKNIVNLISSLSKKDLRSIKLS